MSQTTAIKHYVVVGGGTAGWISAAILARTLANTEHKITVIESPNIATIGVGEATIPSIIDLLNFLNISQHQFIASTQATFKLGIKFVDWLEKNHHYWHPFGNIGSKIDGKAFYQHWLKHHLNGGQYQYTDFSPAIALAKDNKFFIPDPNRKTNLSATTYALHFNASDVAKFLQHYCQQKHVNHIKAHVDNVATSSNGEISSVCLADGQTIAGDFFIDCTGQRGLLIQQTLRVGFDNWQHYLPVDRAVAIQSKSESPVAPYTEAKAHCHGWQWKIPLQNRMGNGYVYCSDYCSDEQALNLLSDNISEPLTEAKFIQFTTGKAKKLWHKNCLAVGLSSGFLEPLESTSIYLIMKTMLNFVSSLPNKNIGQATINEFNRIMSHEYEAIRDFIVLHYCCSNRQDSPFWQMWQQLEIPESLSNKIALFKEQGRLYHDQDDLFAHESWYAVLAGMQVTPHAYDPVVDCSNFPIIEQAFSDSVTALQVSVDKTLTHEQYLAKIRS